MKLDLAWFRFRVLFLLLRAWCWILVARCWVLGGDWRGLRRALAEEMFMAIRYGRLPR
jgi:hypothetical protein